MTCYETAPDSWRSWQNRRPTGLGLFSYLMVSILKLEKGHKELFRIHFPDSKLTEDSDDGQGQQNLGICGRITNMEKLEPGQMCDQSIQY
jgi:hypothetical protein